MAAPGQRGGSRRQNRAEAAWQASGSPKRCPDRSTSGVRKLTVVSAEQARKGFGVITPKPAGRIRPIAPSPMLTAFAGMLALASSQGICRFVYTPILPAMAAGLGMGSSTAGLIASANFLGYLGGAIAATLKRLPGGRRAWFIGSLCVSAISTAAMGVASGLPAYLALRFAGGMSGAFVLVLATAAVLDALADAGRSRLGALHYAGVGVGIALSAIVVAGLEMGGAGWQ
ncbi:MAG: YbfB/YjiJ family MFS transporter, partial [Sphingomonas sp.]